MPTVSFFQIVWRLVLAISLVTAPLVPMPAAAHGDRATVVAPSVANSMPCHEVPAPPPAADEPRDARCGPMPDCDPGACRIAGSLMADVPPMLPALPPATYDVAFDAPAVPGAPLGHLLRPPIA